ncbi:hypothetical protein BOTBODRAFT_142063 [Botryobasidium botryosum FD-172 SS1]|uniref:Uncharacterized protein n=1 Tax=Botryobasidium botryosum (strain FD-172 SS1) TaxID=930990 RepID=A0A067MY12_BOTB1|nr:hypothetical protein BOTBODRAFT_142063 [Botryobasidium botryosum FD-172 SS1]
MRYCFPLICRASNFRFQTKYHPHFAFYPTSKNRMSPNSDSTGADHDHNSELSVVEDSEPEREEQERLKKARKKRKMDEKLRSLANLPVGSCSSGSNARTQLSPSKENAGIYKPGVGTVPPVGLSGLHPDMLEPPIPDIPDAPQSHSPQPSSSVGDMHGLTSSDMTGTSPKRPTRVLNLESFSYINTVKSGIVSTSLPSISKRAVSAAATKHAKPPAKSKTRKPSNPYVALVLPDVQLGILSKCPVCDTAWSTRKTAKVKLDHIRKCADSNLWGEEAVKARVEQAVVEANDDRDAKSAKKVDEGPMGTQTLLEAVIKGAEPRKRTGARRNEEPVTTVQGINKQTRDVILDNARALLFGSGHKDATAGSHASAVRAGRVSTSTSASCKPEPTLETLPDYAMGETGTDGPLPPTQPFTSSKIFSRFHQAAPTHNLGRPSSPAGGVDNDVAMLLLTQPLAPSRLSSALGTSSKQSAWWAAARHEDGQEEHEKMPPPTQAFAPSRLSAIVSTTSRTLSASNAFRSSALAAARPRPGASVIAAPDPLSSPSASTATATFASSLAPSNSSSGSKNISSLFPSRKSATLIAAAAATKPAKSKRPLSPTRNSSNDRQAQSNLEGTQVLDADLQPALRSAEPESEGRAKRRRGVVVDAVGLDEENVLMCVSDEEQGAAGMVAKKSAGKKAAKSKVKSKSKSAPAHLINHGDPDVDLDGILKDMIVNNGELYARILRYERERKGSIPVL